MVAEKYKYVTVILEKKYRNSFIVNTLTAFVSYQGK